MDDLISRKAAIHAFDDAGFCTHDYVVGTLEDLPSAQPECNTGQLLYHHTENIDEVKTADVYFCSSCKKEVLKKIRFGMFSGELDIHYGYCPSCGARMEGESE